MKYRKKFALCIINLLLAIMINVAIMALTYKNFYKIIDIDSVRYQYKMIDLSNHLDIIKKSNELINFVALDDSIIIKRYKMIS